MLFSLPNCKVPLIRMPDGGLGSAHKKIVRKERVRGPPSSNPRHWNISPGTCPALAHHLVPGVEPAASRCPPNGDLAKTIWRGGGAAAGVIRRRNFTGSDCCFLALLRTAFATSVSFFEVGGLADSGITASAQRATSVDSPIPNALCIEASTMALRSWFSTMGCLQTTLQPRAIDSNISPCILDLGPASPVPKLKDSRGRTQSP